METHASPSHEKWWVFLFFDMQWRLQQSRLGKISSETCLFFFPKSYGYRKLMILIRINQISYFVMIKGCFRHMTNSQTLRYNYLCSHCCNFHVVCCLRNGVVRINDLKLNFQIGTCPKKSSSMTFISLTPGSKQSAPVRT